ncbi:MAG: MBL fold metallo-hydrolase [Myxococcota bacterium]|nr:MBL fold metallo-hydrolase [Myxococcota bacterium]
MSDNESVFLFQEEGHAAIMLPDFDTGLGVQANQHLIIHGKEAMLLDPGGHKVYNKVMSHTFKNLKGGIQLKHIFLSHQDPDIVAAVNGWLMTTDADAWVSVLWERFVPHFGLDRLVADRLHGIPDEGRFLSLGGVELMVLPAHFLHSCGNFMVYDPHTKILYSGDLGASLGQDYRIVPDFEAHKQYFEGFHKRYMGGHAALSKWVQMVRQLDIETIAPQHGAMFQGAHVGQFLDWLEALECGPDIMSYTLPQR